MTDHIHNVHSNDCHLRLCARLHKDDVRMDRECKHCINPSTWRWDDADGNEHSYICQRCMETLACYQCRPLWQFTPLSKTVTMSARLIHSTVTTNPVLITGEQWIELLLGFDPFQNATPCWQHINTGQ